MNSESQWSSIMRSAPLAFGGKRGKGSDRTLEVLVGQVNLSFAGSRVTPGERGRGKPTKTRKKLMEKARLVKGAKRRKLKTERDARSAGCGTACNWGGYPSCEGLQWRQDRGAVFSRW